MWGMVVMSSIDTYSAEQRGTLLAVARAALQHGLSHAQPLAVQVDDYSEALRALRATFVTLEKGGQLRGCIGTLAAYQPLVQDVATHAHTAAFNDPRFPALRAEELPLLAVKISVLTPPEALHFSNEADLLAQLRPGQDGLILSFQQQRGTFLPSVWEQLANPALFLAHLKQKAGLAADFWSPQLRVERYTAEYFGDTAASARRDHD